MPAFVGKRLVKKSSISVVGLLLLAAFGAGWATPLPQSTARRKKAAVKAVAKKVQRPVVIPREAMDAVTAWLDVPNSLETPAALVPFLEQLYRVEKNPASAAPVHILHYGDSHTASDDWAGTLRELFQTRFGNGGAGFSHAGRPYNGYRRLDVKSFGSLNWYTHGLVGRTGDWLYGLAGIATTASRPNEYALLDAECQAAELYFLQQPGGGTFDLRVDQGEAQAISTNGEVKPGYVKIPIEPGQHHFEVRTADSKPVRMFGWTTDNAHGVTWETLGINGAQIGMQLGWDEALLRDHIVRRNPALIVLAYGTNEAGNPDLTLEGYRDTYIRALKQMRRASPTTSLLVIGPPDRWVRSRTGWVPMNNIDIIIAAQRQASTAAGAAFFDLRERMGGKGAMGKWVSAGYAQSDYVHFTSQGYRLLGAALYKELTGQFSAYQKVRDEPTVKPGESR